jgi:hypothetical protein
MEREDGEREITWQLQVWDVADSDGMEWSPEASCLVRCWRPQLGEVFQNVADSSCDSVKARTISSPLHLCSELHIGRMRTPWSPPPPVPISVDACVVARDWCIGAGRGKGAPQQPKSTGGTMVDVTGEPAAKSTG